MTRINRCHGFAIVTAIFLLVVLAALGAFIVTVSTTQHVGAALDIQGVRAYHAARAGVEWGIYRIRVDGVGCASAPASTTLPALTFPASATTLQGFAVTVVCSTYIDGGGGSSVTQLSAVACNFPGAGSVCPGNPAVLGYVERRIDISF